eukprot:1501418-Lingulodinium_polyedra.AAC.1
MAWAVPADVLEAARSVWEGPGGPAVLRRRTREQPAAWQPGQGRAEEGATDHAAARGRRGQ